VCLEVPEGLNVASKAYGKNYFHPALMEPRDLSSFNTAKIRPQNKPKSSSNRQKKNEKPCFSHFRDKPARYVVADL
jgi:hypothetical protein